jgi:hypothetical protein
MLLNRYAGGLAFQRNEPAAHRVLEPRPDAVEDEYEHLRRTPNPKRRTRLTRPPNRILYRLAGLVPGLLFSGSALYLGRRPTP